MTSHKMQTLGFLSNVKLNSGSVYKLTDLSLRSDYEGRECSVYNMMMEGNRERSNSFA